MDANSLLFLIAIGIASFALSFYGSALGLSGSVPTAFRELAEKEL